ncbi:MAG: DUF4350 domain-containing protein [Acidiferrobacterales bacterium]|nr:DUF4350 domain-containing protein [Acidiferrobacterales bacterium]
MIATRLLGFGALLLLGLLVFSFFQLYERVEETIDIGYSEEARRNPYLAAKQYLEKLGREAESSIEITVTEHLHPSQTLFIANASVIKSQERVRDLLIWVEAGGHLILAASEDDVESSRGLFSTLGINVSHIPAAYPRFRSCKDLGSSKDRQKHEGESGNGESVSEVLEQLNREAKQVANNQGGAEPKGKSDRCLDKKYQTRLEFSDTDSPFYVHFPGRLGFEWEESNNARPFYYAEDNAGIRFAQVEIGDGLVSLLSSPVIWRSSHIALFDNAYLVWALSESGEQFTILYGSSMPSLVSQIWERGYEFVLVGLLMIVLWIWHVAKRVVPFRDPNVMHRRSVLEHLQARGDFLWKHAEYNAIVLPLKQDILQKCRMRIPTFYLASTEQQIHLIATTCKLDIGKVQLLFSDTGCETAQQCQQQIEIAQRIRNRI